MSSDTSYNTYDKITSIDWNGQHFILTARDEITGNTFTYAHSSDGISWTKSSIASSKNPYAIKFLGDQFMMVGNLVTSSTDSLGNTVSKNCIIDIVDGNHPVEITTNINGNSAIYDIERNIEQPHRIVFPKTITLSVGNTITYSIDKGQTWTSITNSPFSNSVKDAVCNGNQWVAVGSGLANTIATSLDGRKWTGRGKTIFSSSCNGIDWSPEQKKYVAVGSGTNIVATSMDGIYWRGTSTTLFSLEGNDIKWNGKIWVAVGSNTTPGNTIAYSNDAITWQYSVITFQTAGLRIHYEDNLWTIYGSDPSYNIATSSDGMHWSFSYFANANTLTFNLPTGLFPDPSLNIYPGVPYPLIHNATNNANKYLYNKSDYGIVYIQPISVACGSGANSLAYSIDGIQWTSIKNSLFTQCNKSIWNGVTWVAVGAGNYWVATSFDGILWTGQNSALMTECYDIAWNGSYFIAVGIGSTRMARSIDGITWQSITSANSIFTTNIHAIEWTGYVWLAYGSGNNTTAISSSLDASGWTSTSTPNLCLVDCSNILIGNISNTSASSYQGTDVAENAFDSSFNNVITKWSSSNSNYDDSGNYIGSNTTQGISGEWLQVQLSASLSCSNYYIIFSVSDGSAIPHSWSLLGSTNGTSWDVIDTFDYGTNSVPNNSWKYPFICLPLAINPLLVASYSHYRLVISKTFGGSSVRIAELVLFNSGSSQLTRTIRPIVLKDVILHPTRILSVDGTIPNVYRMTDLSCNTILRTHGGHHVNNIIYGLSKEPSATLFDGVNHVICSVSGEVSYLSNTASNTNLNFDNSMNGVTITGVNGLVIAACYNRKFILIGSSYGIFNEYTTPTFYANNLSSLFTTINNLASNSGYGFVVSPNTIYLEEGERLSVVTPKFYDNEISPDTSISFNVYKSSA